MNEKNKKINCLSVRKEKANEILSILKSIDDIELEEDCSDRISIWANGFRQNNVSLDFPINSFKKELLQLIDKHIYGF